MGKQLLQDTMSIRLSMVEADASGRTVLRGEFGRADVPTANKRIYKRSLWEREINKLRPLIETNKVYSETDHPADGKTKLSRSSCLLTSLEIDKNGIVIGELTVMGTAAGKDLQAILDAGGAVGVSSRGYGSVKMNEDGNDVVQEDYSLMTFDTVADPAQHTAYPEVSVEGKDVKNPVAETKGVSTKQLLTSDGGPALKVTIEAADKPEDKPTDEPEADKKEDIKEVPATADVQPVQTPAPVVPEVVAKDTPMAAAAPQDGPHAAEAPGEHQKAFATDNAVAVDEKAAGVADSGSQPVDNLGTESGEPKDDADVVDGGVKAQVDSAEDKERDDEPEVESITRAEHDRLVAEMTTKFEGQLAVAMKQAHVQIEEKVLADLMADPEVAGSKLALETVKRILRPYIMPSDVNESLELKDAELKGLRAKNESQQREIRNLTVAVKDLGYNLYLSKRLGNHPKFAKIVEGLGDLTKIESLEDLKTRVKLFEDELPEVLRMAQEARTKTVGRLKDRVAQLESRISEVNDQMKKLSEERDQAIHTGLESASRSYLERKIAHLENPAQIRAAYENTTNRTKEGIDKLVESYQRREINASRDFSRIRERLGGRAKSATLVEDALKGTRKEDFRPETANEVRVTDDFAMPLKEMEKLAGLPQG